MSKKLMIVRHGSAENFNSGIQDFERDLTDEGRASSIAVAEKLLQKDQVPALLVSSSAKRAHKTAQLFAATWNIPKDSIILHPGIYESSLQKLTELIQNFNDSYNFIAIFGHNPGFTDLVNYLCSSVVVELPTSGAVLMEFSVSRWKAIEEKTGTVLRALKP